MKRNIVLILLIFVTGSLFFGCKKGPEDPFFSFRSRKVRVAGNYNITAYTETFKKVFPETGKTSEQHEITITGTSYSSSVKYLGLTSKLGGDSMLTTEFPTKTGWKVTGTVIKYTMDFDKRGDLTGVFEYKIEAKKSFSEAAPPYDTVITITRKNEFNGSWDFLTGVDNYKKKERISLIYEDNQVTETWVYVKKYTDETPSPPSETKQSFHSFRYANGENSEVFEIKELRTKKMVFHQFIEDYEIERTDTGSYAISESGERTITLEEASKK